MYYGSEGVNSGGVHNMGIPVGPMSPMGIPREWKAYAEFMVMEWEQEWWTGNGREWKL